MLLSPWKIALLKRYDLLHTRRIIERAEISNAERDKNAMISRCRKILGKTPKTIENIETACPTEKKTISRAILCVDFAL
jgi:hypothetical protein